MDSGPKSGKLVKEGKIWKVLWKLGKEGKIGKVLLGGGGTQIIFWQSVRPEVRNPYPYQRIFLTQKMAD